VMELTKGDAQKMLHSESFLQKVRLCKLQNWLRFE